MRTTTLKVEEIRVQGIADHRAQQEVQARMIQHAALRAIEIGQLTGVWPGKSYPVERFVICFDNYLEGRPKDQESATADGFAAYFAKLLTSKFHLPHDAVLYEAVSDEN